MKKTFFEVAELFELINELHSKILGEYYDIPAGLDSTDKRLSKLDVLDGIEQVKAILASRCKYYFLEDCE